MRKALIALTLFGILALYLSCDIFGSKPDYYPLSIGSTWNWYAWTIMNTSTDGTPDTVQTLTINTRATKNDKLTSGEDVVQLIKVGTVHLRYPRESTYTVDETCYVRKTDKFVLSYDRKDDSEPDTVLALPLAAGKQWRINQELTAKALEQEDITVAAGTYRNAWKIETRAVSGGNTIIMFQWYADKVGNVQYHSEQSYSGYTFIYHGELISATVK
jgi:hypothetical protein